MSRSETVDESGVVERPRWAVRELISWIAAVLLILAVGALVGGAFRTIDQLVGPEGTVVVSAPFGGTDQGFEGRPLPPGTALQQDGSATATLHVAALPAELRLLIGSGHALAAIGTFAAALYGRRFLLSIWDGRPFDPRNPRRLVGVGLGLLVGGVGSSAMGSVASHAVLAHLGRRPDQADTALAAPALPVDLDGLWWALIALAVAEAFRRGRQLAEDADGLV